MGRRKGLRGKVEADSLRCRSVRADKKPASAIMTAGIPTARGNGTWSAGSSGARDGTAALEAEVASSLLDGRCCGEASKNNRARERREGRA
jgi:hypothetical protein